MNDLLITAVKDRRWEDLDCFALSVVRSGFAGMKVMFVDNVTEEAKQHLADLEWHVCECRHASGLHFQSWRYYPILEFLMGTRGQFRYVFVTDACDVVWQRDPTVWLEDNIGGSMTVVAAQEGWKIKDQEINDIWIKRLVTDQEYRRLREEEVLCSGTIQGSAEAVISTITAMTGMFGDEMQGIDQGIFNVILRRPELGIQVRITRPLECFISTLGIFLAPSDQTKWTVAPPRLNWDNGTVANVAGALFPIVHQYNRRYGPLDPGGSWRETLERRYRS